MDYNYRALRLKELNLKPIEVYEMHIHEFLYYWCNFFKAERIETERQYELQKMRK